MGKLKGPVLNSTDAAKHCGFKGGSQTMRDFKTKGTGPKWGKHGRVLVYRVEDLDEWMQEREVENV